MLHEVLWKEKTLPCCNFATFHLNLTSLQRSAEVKGTIWIWTFLNYWQELAKVPPMGRVSGFHWKQLSVKSPVLIDWIYRHGGQKTDQNLVCGQKPSLDNIKPAQQLSWEVSLRGCTKKCVRQTYPIQEAAGPEDHFPLEHQTAEGKTERETKQIRLGHLSVALLPSSSPLRGFLSGFVLVVRHTAVILTTAWGWGKWLGKNIPKKYRNEGKPMKVQMSKKNNTLEKKMLVKLT